MAQHFITTAERTAINEMNNFPVDGQTFEQILNARNVQFNVNDAQAAAVRQGYEPLGLRERIVISLSPFVYKRLFDRLSSILIIENRAKIRQLFGIDPPEDLLNPNMPDIVIVPSERETVPIRVVQKGVNFDINISGAVENGQVTIKLKDMDDMVVASYLVTASSTGSGTVQVQFPASYSGNRGKISLAQTVVNKDELATDSPSSPIVHNEVHLITVQN